MTRILITGSRGWKDAWRFHSTVADYLRSRGQWDDDEGHATGRVTIVHGACRDGADMLADDWAYAQGIAREPHPAKWGRYGRAAGHKRNAHVVSLGADWCAAFIMPCTDTKPECLARGPHGTHGASGCADMAEAAGIPTKRVDP